MKPRLPREPTSNPFRRQARGLVCLPVPGAGPIGNFPGFRGRLGRQISRYRTKAYSGSSSKTRFVVPIHYPRVCGQGDHAIVVWNKSNGGFEVITSDNGGVSFAPAIQLGDAAYRMFGLDCSASGEVVLSALDSQWANFLAWRFDGVDWSGPTLIPTPDGVFQDVQVAFTDASGLEVIVVYQGHDRTFYANRSSNGGATFMSPLTLYVPADDSAWPDSFHVVSDRLGTVWVFWIDRGLYGATSIFSTRSTDSGTTFGEPLRINRESPRGAFANEYHRAFRPAMPNAVALPGAGFVTWAGQRDSSHFRALINVDDLSDVDGDGFTHPGDCNDADATVHSAPSEVSDLALGTNKTTLTWNSAAEEAGLGTVHDVVRGTAYPVEPGAMNTCVDSGIDEVTTTDVGNPSGAEVFWYLVRGRNSCGVGTYGTDSEGTERSTDACP